MKKVVLVIAVTLMVVAMLVTPVMAIGPSHAAEVDKNPNLSLIAGGLVNSKGEAGGSNVWASVEDFYVRWKFLDALDAKGIMNQAIMATNVAQISQMVYSGDYDNEWIYLSGDGGSNPYQLNSHGMLWWFFFFTFGGNSNPNAGAYASAVANQFPSGVFWSINHIQQ